MNDKTLLTMEQNNKIQEALEIINHHDWFWMMVEYGYEASYNSAKASMRSFVALVKTIDNETIREALKALWMLRFNAARNNEDNKAKEEELMNTLALAA